MALLLIVVGIGVWVENRTGSGRRSAQDRAIADSLAVLEQVVGTQRERTAEEGRQRARGRGETVRLTLTPAISGNTLLIEGKTDLPSGTLLAYEVTHGSLLSTPTEFANGLIEVRDGLYSHQVGIAGWPPGEMEIWVAFSTIVGTERNQPADIIDRYGQMGEKLVGSNVTGDGLKRIELVDTMRLRR